MKPTYKKWLQELIEPDSIDLDSFKIQDSLHPKFWDEQDKLDPRIRKRLVRIALKFMEELDISKDDILDITMTGSLANYNWSKFSDIDLHIIVNYSDIDSDSEMAQDYITAKRIQWNNTHNIKIYGFEVEVYVEDDSEEHMSTGIYSVQYDQWKVKPTKQDVSFCEDCVQKKAAGLMDEVDSIENAFSEQRYNEVLTSTQRIKDKIKKMRQSGLESGGAYSVENLAFKVLRRNGYLGKLSDLKNASYDELMSMENGGGRIRIKI
tara:strand:+ start:47 stop:838 length:792 start_codon:yes stop_codon:yes gene_type:complete